MELGLDLITPLRLFLLVLTGLGLGYFLMSLPIFASKIKVTYFMLTFIGISFFLPILLDRLVEVGSGWQGLLGTWISYQIYITALSTGIWIRHELL